MGEPHQVLQTERPGAALDRMDGAEDGVDRLQVGLPLLQQHQLLFQVREQFVTFLEEGGLDGFEGVHASSLIGLLD